MALDSGTSHILIAVGSPQSHVERAMGVLMVIIGTDFQTGAVSNVSIWLLEIFPMLQTIGQGSRFGRREARADRDHIARIKA